MQGWIRRRRTYLPGSLMAKQKGDWERAPLGDIAEGGCEKSEILGNRGKKKNKKSSCGVSQEYELHLQRR